MKYYAQFWIRGCVTGELIEGCGDRAIIRLDGRLSDYTMRAIAADECRKRGFLAYTMLRGESLLQARQVGPRQSVENMTDLETASRRYA